jgi:class 3 adenylate cyclase
VNGADANDGMRSELRQAAATAGLLDVEERLLAERWELVEFLDEQGCLIEEMVAADRRGRLFGLAGDRILRPGGSVYSLEELAQHLAMEVETIRRIWEALGFRAPTHGLLVISVDERDVFEQMPLLLGLIGETALLDLCRSVAISLGGVAEATSSVARSQPEMSTALSGSELSTAKAWARNARFTPWMGHLLDVLFRRHLEGARQWFEASDSYATAAQQQLELAIGFADVSGYTAATEAMTARELCELVRRFEQASIDAVQAGGARVVKFIGDAAMIVAPSADELASAVTRLVSAWEPGHAGATGIRAGLAYGSMTSRQGDYFGSAVNLAARLVAVAPRHTILVDDTFAHRLSAGTWRLGTVEELDVRGFAHRIATRSLLASTDSEPATE